VREAGNELMRHLGITKLFGNPDSVGLPVLRDFSSDFQYVLGLQEAVVVGLVDGYVQVTGNTSPVNLYSVAGVGNVMRNTELIESPPHRAHARDRPLPLVPRKTGRIWLKLRSPESGFT
jgi:hypothetical protein